MPALPSDGSGVPLPPSHPVVTSVAVQPNDASADVNPVTGRAYYVEPAPRGTAKERVVMSIDAHGDSVTPAADSDPTAATNDAALAAGIDTSAAPAASRDNTAALQSLAAANNAWYMRFWRVFNEHAFLFGMAFAVLLAATVPAFGRKGGPLRPEYTIKYGAIPLTFVLSGVSMKTDQFLKAITHYKLNALIQLFNLVFIPFALWVVASLLRLTPMNGSLCDGLILVGCLPTTISMGFLLTKSAGGNEAVALFNATFGNLFGVVYTPGLILLLFGSDTGIDTVSAFEEIGGTVFAPFIAGQLIQRLAWVQTRVLKPLAPYIAPFGKWILLVLAYTVFCDTFSQSHSDSPIPVASVAVIIPLVIALYGAMFVCARAFFAWRVFGPFRRADQIAAWFTATHKTLALGIPILQILFGADPNIGLITIPLLIYHPTQLFSGSILANYIAKWYQQNPDPPIPTAAANDDLTQLARIAALSPPGQNQTLTDATTTDSSGGDAVVPVAFAAASNADGANGDIGAAERQTAAVAADSTVSSTSIHSN